MSKEPGVRNFHGPPTLAPDQNASLRDRLDAKVDCPCVLACACPCSCCQRRVWSQHVASKSRCQAHTTPLAQARSHNTCCRGFKSKQTYTTGQAPYLSTCSPYNPSQMHPAVLPEDHPFVEGFLLVSPSSLKGVPGPVSVWILCFRLKCAPTRAPPKRTHLSSCRAVGELRSVWATWIQSATGFLWGPDINCHISGLHFANTNVAMVPEGGRLEDQLLLGRTPVSVTFLAICSRSVGQVTAQLFQQLPTLLCMEAGQKGLV